MPRRTTVIVGGSAAGLSTAEGLRSGGYDGHVVIVSDEFATPYDRPPLSKQVLAGKWSPHEAALLPPERFKALRARFLLGTRASGLDVERREVELDNGPSLRFDDLVIATGVRPRTLPGADVPGVHILRTMTDAIALRERLLSTRHLALIGAGFLGLEVAATAAALGVGVTVVEPLAAPMVAQLGPVVAHRLVDHHREAGVDLRTGVSVREIVENGEPGSARHVAGIRLSDGSLVTADTVLVAIGCTPAVEWLEGSALDLSDGVVCDTCCRAAPGVWAAGDVARWRHAGYERDMRLEHRANATEQGLAVGRGIAAGRPRPFAPVPYFWTDHGDVRIQVIGALAGDVEVVEGDPDGDSFVQRWSIDGVPVGGIAWNAPRSATRMRAALMRG